jgi:hypothetical protein
MATPDRQRFVEAPPGAPELGRVLLLVAIVLMLLFAASFVLLWQLEVFDANTRKSNAQILAAAIGLVGVLVTASLTFIGVLLKHSIDLRTIQQNAETEGRLRLETSIRAVELVSQEEGTATKTRRAGALFVLANLNQLDFASALLSQMWHDRQVSPSAATWVVNRLLLSGEPSLQEAAAVELEANAHTLARSDGFQFPESMLFRWSNELPTTARESILSAFIMMILSKPREDWSREDLNTCVYQLDIVRKQDKDSHVRNGALLCLDALLEAREIDDPDLFIFAPNGKLHVGDLIAEVRPLVPEIGEADAAHLHRVLAERLRTEWPRAGRKPKARAPRGLGLIGRFRRAASGCTSRSACSRLR